MPQPRDKKLSKRALKRLEGDETPPGQPVSNLRPLSMSAPMHSWPVHECLVPENWRSPGELVQLVVTRRSDAGEFASALFLVDLGCLGVKNAYTTRFTDDTDYQAWLETIPSAPTMVRISFDLAARIVQTGIDYAASLGFRPHRDYSLAAPFLRDAEPDRSTDDVPTGFDGKPYFISGPYDNVRKITEQLRRKVGEGNFHVLAGGPLGALPPEILDALDETDDPA